MSTLIYKPMSEDDKEAQQRARILALAREKYGPDVELVEYYDPVRKGYVAQIRRIKNDQVS